MRAWNVRDVWDPIQLRSGMMVLRAVWDRARALEMEMTVTRVQVKHGRRSSTREGEKGKSDSEKERFRRENGEPYRATNRFAS
jgi:hypothetical protein